MLVSFLNIIVSLQSRCCIDWSIARSEKIDTIPITTIISGLNLVTFRNESQAIEIFIKHQMVIDN